MKMNMITTMRTKFQKEIITEILEILLLVEF